MASHGGAYEEPGTVYEYRAFRERIEELSTLSEELRDYAAMVRAFSQAGPDDLFLTDLDGTFLDWAPAAREPISGYTKDDVVGRTFFQLRLVLPRDTERAAALLARTRAGEPTGPDEFVLNRKDGTQVPVEIRTRPIKVGSLSLVAGVARDITERKRTENALKECKARLSTIIQQSPVAVAILSADGRIVDVNSAFLELWDISPDTMREVRGHYNILRDEQVRSLGSLLYFERAFAGEPLTVPPAEYDASQTLQRFRPGTAEGRKRWVQSRVFALFDERGQVTNVAMILEDITDRRHAEEELRASEAQLSNALKMARAGHWEYDVLSDAFTFNDNFYRIFRTTASELGGYTMSAAEYARRFCHPDDMHMVRKEIQGAIETGDPYYDRILEHRILYADGEVGHVAVRFFVVKDSQGRTVRTYGVNQDITNRVLAEQRIRSALESTIQVIAETIEARDPYTAGHQKRVTGLAVAIAQRMALPDQQVEGIRVAATLHDIGKISVPAEILSKPATLSQTELSLIREHPAVAYAILKRIEFPWPVAEIIRQHHERLDGTGYPAGLTGEQIRLEARVIAVADVVEAMSSHRPYRPALGIEAALREIEEKKGKFYDPDVVAACVALFETGGFSLDSQ